MIVYELTHLFFRYSDEVICSPKKLGLYCSYESVQRAIQDYCTQPGFLENQDAFSIRERNVLGTISNDTVFEVIVYIHSKDYGFETEIDLGLYADEMTAQKQLAKYCQANILLISAKELIAEKIINKFILENREWISGFSISR